MLLTSPEGASEGMLFSATCSPLRLHRQDPTRTYGVSIDHLVRGNQQRGWHAQAKCSCGPEVDSHFIFGRALDRQIGGLLSTENTIDIDSGLAAQIDNIDRVVNQAALGGRSGQSKDRRH